MALRAGSSDGLDVLALAVVLHRVSDGLGIWWLARPAYGKRVAALLLGTLAVFSVVGFRFAQPITGGASHAWIALFQALIAGSLLHVILRHPPSAPRAGAAPASSTKLASGIGGLLGLVLVLALEAFVADGGSGIGSVSGAGQAFLELALEVRRRLPRLRRGRALHALGIDLAALLGGARPCARSCARGAGRSSMPICSCGVIPLYRNLVLQGVPTRAALSFLVAAPELGVTALFLSASLLGLEITLVCAAAAATLALVVGLTVGGSAPVAERAQERAARGARAPFASRLAGGLRYGFGDMVDSTAPWILVGLGLAALLGPWLSAEALEGVPRALEVPLFALIGMPLYVCASGSTPLAAVLIAKGVSPGAAIAFLLTGPATNVTTFGVLARLHSKRTAVLFALTTALVTTALGWTANALVSGHGLALPQHAHAHGGDWLELACAAVLLALFVVSVLRQGTRAFVGQVISPHGAAAHDHDHDHDHPHDDEHGHNEHGHGELAHEHADGCCGAPARSA